jgi:hypothetical protein
VRGWNLSYECLTSYNAREKLRDIATNNQELYCKIIGDKMNIPDEHIALPEDNLDNEVEYEDDVEVPIKKAVRAFTTGTLSEDDNVTFDGGNLQIVTEAETTMEVDGVGMVNVEQEGRGKRLKKRNKLYDVQQFCRHWDEDDSDVE